MLKTLATSLAIICIIALILCIPLSLFAFDLGRTVFNVPVVKRILTDEVVNSDLVPVVLEWFSERRAQQRVDSGQALTGIDEPDIVLLMSFIDRVGWKNIKEEILTSEILAAWVNVTVDGFYNWIDSTDRTPQITLNLEPFKNQVDSEYGVNAIMIAFDYLDPCSQEQIDDFKKRLTAAPAGSDVLYNLCAFPDPWSEDQFSDYVNSLQDVVAHVPPSFALTAELAQIGETQGIGPEALKQQVRLTRTIARLAWIPPVVLLIILLLLRPVWSIKTRAGLPLIVGGVLALLPPLLYRDSVSRWLASGPLSEVPDVVKAEATRSILRLAAEIFKPMVIQAAVVLVAGIGVIVVSMILGNKKGTPQAGKEELSSTGSEQSELAKTDNEPG